MSRVITIIYVYLLSHFSRVQLCDPVDLSPSGSSVHGIIQARILEWVAMSSSGNLPDPGMETRSLESPASQADSLPAELLGSPMSIICNN